MSIHQILTTLTRPRRRNRSAPVSPTTEVLHDQSRPASWDVDLLHAFSRLR